MRNLIDPLIELSEYRIFRIFHSVKVPFNMWLNGKVNGKLNEAFRIPPQLIKSSNCLIAEAPCNTLLNVPFKSGLDLAFPCLVLVHIP